MTPLLAVFDLDSTLFDLHLRVARIVDSFALDPVQIARFPRECAALKDIQILRSDWGVGEALVRIGLTEISNREFWDELHKHWAAGFFSNDFLDHDEPLPGAVEYVQQLHKNGAHVMYLTGRDVPRMLSGTEKSLHDRGFPVEGKGISLVLKPVAGMDDARFKADILREEVAKHAKIYLFENEPVNLNLVAKELPSIGLVYIDSTHSGREQVADTLDKIVHFEVGQTDFKSN